MNRKSRSTTPQKKSTSKDSKDDLEERRNPFKSNHCLLRITIPELSSQHSHFLTQKKKFIEPFVVAFLEQQYSLEAEEVYVLDLMKKNPVAPNLQPLIEDPTLLNLQAKIEDPFPSDFQTGIQGPVPADERIEFVMFFVFPKNIPTAIPREMEAKFGFFTLILTMLQYQNKKDSKFSGFIDRYPAARKFYRKRAMMCSPEDDLLPPFERARTEHETDKLIPACDEYDQHTLGTSWKVYDFLYTQMREDLSRLGKIQQYLGFVQMKDSKVLEEAATLRKNCLQSLQKEKVVLEKELEEVNEKLRQLNHLTIEFEKNYGVGKYFSKEDL